MYSLILIGLISKCLNTSDYRYQQECGTAWKIILFENITAVSPGGRHENTQITMLRNSGRFIENFREMIFIQKIPIRNLFFFLLQVKEMNMSKRKSFFFYKLISTVIFWKLCIARKGSYYRIILKCCNCCYVKLSPFV